MSYDPIASHGILMGLVGARDAAVAIVNFFNGHKDSLAEYGQILFGAFCEYSKQRRQFYLSEKRFPESSYWQKRRANLGVEAVLE